MKYSAKKMCKTIMANDPADFDRDFNKFVQGVVDRGYPYDVRYVDGLGKLCCQIFYESKIEIPETLEEEYYLVGEECHCYDCPFWKELQGNDRRKKYYRCSHGEGLAYAERCACEWFYATQKEGGTDGGQS